MDMKKFFLVLILFSFINKITAQIIFSDDFNQGINNTGYPDSYTSSLVSNNLRLSGNGSAAAYDAISYDIHLNGVLTTIDISGSNKLYIKVKGTNSPSFRIDLQDNVGYSTNLNPSVVSLSSNYTIFEIDYTNKYQDGAYGGPCTLSPCTVNSSAIKRLVFFVNPGVGNYNGTIDIDWISFGEPLESIIPSHSIRYNQIGYFVGKSKMINLIAASTFTGINYEVRNNANAIILSGVSPASSWWVDGQQYVASVDITAVDTPGVYTFITNSEQITFTVANDVYYALADASFKYYYYNRASTEITPTHGGAWARATGIPDNTVLVHSSAASPNRPTGTVISAPKGWYDAGDYNKYIVNSGISTYTLLAAYEQYTNYYQNRNFNIPESNNTLPDILDEIIWNLDWMLAMQDKIIDGGDGGVYHKLTELNFSGIVMPSAYNSTRYVVKKSTAATLNFAAVTAIASRVFAAYPTQKPGYSALLLEASREAYTWAKNNPTVYFTNPSGVNTGEYGDGYVGDEFQWAAIELFITTGELQYKNDINSNALNGSVPAWPNTGTLGLISILHHRTELINEINVPLFTNKIINTANQIKANVNASAMKISMTSSDYVWGSNGTTANQIMLLLNAYELTNDNSYLDAAYVATDYLLGRNALGKCFVTGYGTNPVLQPHHRISEADNIVLPVPGMLAGGPQANASSIDVCNYPNNFAASSYSDSWCSYATNEVTINWNAPLVYITNALQYYQNQSTLSNVSWNQMTQRDVVLYPNPVSNEMYLEKRNISELIKVKIYDLQGRIVLDKLVQSEDFMINVDFLIKGIYLVELQAENFTEIKKIIKN